jgi:molybdopterin-guanine dinucleotide biosynthesis protein MobB
MIVVSLVGLKKCGKTTVAEALIREFKSRGYKVGGVKVMHHASMTIDREAKDTWRQKKAGADLVVSLSKRELGYIESLEKPAMLADALRIIPEDTDILICEGLTDASPDVLRIVLAERPELLPETFEVRGHSENVIALSGIMANETKVHPEYPIFDCTNEDDVKKLADLIIEKANEHNRTTKETPNRAS